MFIDVGRPHPLWAALFLTQEVLNDIREEKLSRAQASQ